MNEQHEFDHDLFSHTSRSPQQPFGRQGQGGDHAAASPFGAAHTNDGTRRPDWDSILPGRLSETLLSQWDYDGELSLNLGRQDRSAIYGGFHIYRKKP